jgi:hypothetical protein
VGPPPGMRSYDDDEQQQQEDPFVSRRPPVGNSPPRGATTTATHKPLPPVADRPSAIRSRPQWNASGVDDEDDTDIAAAAQGAATHRAPEKCAVSPLSHYAAL